MDDDNAELSGSFQALEMLAYNTGLPLETALAWARQQFDLGGMRRPGVVTTDGGNASYDKEDDEGTSEEYEDDDDDDGEGDYVDDDDGGDDDGYAVRSSLCRVDACVRFRGQMSSDSR